ncbi:transposase, IS4 family protein [Brucella thiophenivorans]|uniref:Transposase, IS4 family protein n=1 Tax=Brucella thiophenivorans TaxID=571255 RepID=A0A256F342_9HYPH|nr:transposase, IS4 family protein [Brucella thiophenivorans]
MAGAITVIPYRSNRRNIPKHSAVALHGGRARIEQMTGKLKTVQTCRFTLRENSKKLPINRRNRSGFHLNQIRPKGLGGSMPLIVAVLLLWLAPRHERWPDA